MAIYPPPRNILPIFNGNEFNYLDENQLTISEADGRYLQLTGGILTGSLETPLLNTDLINSSNDLILSRNSSQRERLLSTETDFINSSIKNTYDGETLIIEKVNGTDIIKVDTVNDQLLVSDGSFSNPGISFINDPDTGFLRNGSGLIYIISNGTTILTMDNTAISTLERFFFTSGSASLPSISFNGDQNTGIYNSNTDEISFSTGGVQKMYLNTNGLTITDQLVVNEDISCVNQPFMRRSLSGTTSLSNSVIVTVPFVTENTNIGVNDLITYSAGIFTINSSGKYIISFSITLDIINTITSDNSFSAYIDINGSRFAYNRIFFTSVSATSIFATGALIYQFTTSNTFSLKVIQTTGDTQQLNSALAGNNIEVSKML